MKFSKIRKKLFIKIGGGGIWLSASRDENITTKLTIWNIYVEISKFYVANYSSNDAQHVMPDIITKN